VTRATHLFHHPLDVRPVRAVRLVVNLLAELKGDPRVSPSLVKLRVDNGRPGRLDAHLVVPVTEVCSVIVSLPIVRTEAMVAQVLHVERVARRPRVKRVDQRVAVAVLDQRKVDDLLEGALPVASELHQLPAERRDVSLGALLQKRVSERFEKEVGALPDGQLPIRSDLEEQQVAG